jgi:hypothetical protein
MTDIASGADERGEDDGQVRMKPFKKIMLKGLRVSLKEKKWISS